MVIASPHHGNEFAVANGDWVGSDRLGDRRQVEGRPGDRRQAENGLCGRQQSGVALVVALVLLMAVTVVAVSAMNGLSVAGMTIGAQSATIHANFLEDIYADSDVRLYPTQDEANLDLAAGRIDLILADSIVLYEWLETDDGSCCTFVGDAYSDPDYFGFGAGIALRQEDDELRERLNAALAAIIENGTWQNINDDYFPFSIY